MAEANGGPSPSAAQSQSSLQPPAQTTAPASPRPANTPADNTEPPIPQTSTADPGTTPRPRDARTLHLLLHALGVPAYQSRVPLQLLDYAYRYTAGVLSDAQHLGAEGYLVAEGPGAGRKGGTGEGDVNLAAVRLAAAARSNAAQSGAMSKEALLEIAAERNRVRLPAVSEAGRFGVRLPQERFLMTGSGWGLKEEWSDEEAEEDDGDEEMGEAGDGVARENEEEDGRGEGEDGEGGYEDVFGKEEKADEDEDLKMEDG